MEITAAQVKELREKTGAGIMDAKKALIESEGDMEKATEILRQKGVASADKKMSRIAAEGAIGSVIEGNVGAMIEVNCETDFVAKNDEFKALVQEMATLILKNNPKDVEELTASKTESGVVVEEYIKEKIAKIGEKITLRRFVRLEGNVASYIHNSKIGVLLQTSEKQDDIAKDICLHIASSAPEFVSRKEIPQALIDDETRIEMGKEDLASKPEQIRAKIVEGRVNKLMAQRCLLEQPFVKNTDQTIEQLISGKTEIVSFNRWNLGEGLEKRQDNFADEVMKQIG
jgi:elongation factor Ts